MNATERLTLTPGASGQVAEITGAHTKAGQLKVLRSNGLRHWLNAGGWPVVPLSAVDGIEAHNADPGWKPRKSA